MKTLFKVITFQKQKDLCILNKTFWNDTLNPVPRASRSVELVELTTSDFKPAQTIPQFSSQIDAADLFPETGTDQGLTCTSKLPRCFLGGLEQAEQSDRIVQQSEDFYVLFKGDMRHTTP